MPLTRPLRFRRRLFIAGGAVGAILLLAFYLVFHSASQAAGMNRWVEHSQAVLSIIARARLEPASLQNHVWAYRSAHDPELPRHFPVYLQSLADEIETLRELTADNSAQQHLLTELGPILNTQMLSLGQAMDARRLLRTSAPIGLSIGRFRRSSRNTYRDFSMRWKPTSARCRPSDPARFETMPATQT